VPEILKVFELSQDHGVAKVQVRRGRIHAQLDAQRLAGFERAFELRAQIALADDFRRALFDVSELFVNRSEGWHAV